MHAEKIKRETPDDKLANIAYASLEELESNSVEA